MFVCISVFCAIVSHPADTIVSYMNKSQGSTIGSAAKALGFKGMWAGLGPRIIMIGTLTALQWFIYDFVKVSNGYDFIQKYHVFNFALISGYPQAPQATPTPDARVAQEEARGRPEVSRCEPTYWMVNIFCRTLCFTLICKCLSKTTTTPDRKPIRQNPNFTSFFREKSKEIIVNLVSPAEINISHFFLNFQVVE